MKKVFETPAMEIFHLAVADELTAGESGMIEEGIQLGTFGLRGIEGVFDWDSK